MKAAELVVRCLENEGVRYVFGLPGEEALGLLDALQGSSIRMVGTRHEQGAAFMADVYGRLSGRAGVCLSTLGPGATNLLTGVADANMDRAPLVAITSQTSMMRRHKESHQAIDLLAVFNPVTKWNQALTRSAIIPEAIRKAFKVAQTEKPGAVLLELPEDVAAEDLAEGPAPLPLSVQQPVTPEPLPAQVERGRKTLAAARRPVVLAGNGVVRGRAHEAVRRFAERLQIPVVQTFMAKGVVSDTSPLSLFTIGMPARDYAGRVMEEADCVIAAGYDFVEYAPCRWNPARDKHIIHVDVSPAEVDAHYIVDVGILGDVAHALDRLAEGSAPVDRAWAERARRQVWEGFQAEWALPRGWPLKPQHVLQDLRAVLAPDDLVVCDVGAHKIWMARMFPCEQPNTCVISNGFAAMGIAVPGSVAAKLLHPERQVVAVSGDGGFTLLEVIVVVFILGMLAAIVAPRIIGRTDDAKIADAKVQIRNLETALKLYKIDSGSFPDTQQGLDALINKPAAGNIPNNYREGGYLEQKTVPLDPWGNPYVYVSPGLHGDYDIMSYGGDGREGGEGKDADITSWDMK